MKQLGYYAMPEQRKRLNRLFFEKGASISQLIRYALDRVYFDGGEAQN